jgi:hypothetical protein
MGKVIGIDISKQTFDVSWKEKSKTVQWFLIITRKGSNYLSNT